MKKEKKFKLYTPEQEAKIEALRKKAEEEKAKSKETAEWLKNIPSDTGENKPLQAGDPCRVVIGGNTLVGTLINVRKGKEGKKVYDISTPLGPLKNFTIEYPKQYISKRKIEDFSEVEIPERLKTFSTQQLLRMLQIARLEDQYDDFGGYERKTHTYTFEQLKAILATRPHVTNKRETKAIRKYQKMQK